MDSFRCLMVIFVYFLIGIRHQIFALTTTFVECRPWPLNSTVRIQVGATSRSDSSGILKTSYFGGYEGGLNCKIVLRPESPDGIILSIRKLDFRPGCRDSITIENYLGSTLESYCYDKDDTNEYTAHHSSGSMTIIFQTASGSASSLYKGFELVYTAYSRTPCLSSEFQCPRGCIWKYLKCDGHNHCGDRSDQRNCDSTKTPTEDFVVTSSRTPRDIGRIIGIVSGCIFLFVAAIIAGAIYRKRKYRTTVGTVIHPPPPPQHPYGAQYPVPRMYPGSFYPQPGQMNYPPPQYSPSPVQQSG